MMEPVLLGALGLVLLFVLLFLRLPVAFTFIIIGFGGLVYLRGFTAAMSSLGQSAWSSATSYYFMAIPLFVLMGQFAANSDIGKELYATASKWLGRLPGGLALGTVWGCAGFAACTGSSTAGVLTFGPIAYKPMIELNYSRSLAVSTILCGATMGILIPPAIGFIIYGGITEEPIGRLFMAGILPGILQATLYTLVIIFVTTLGIQAGPPGPACSWKEKFVSLRGVGGMLSLVLLVIGGIYMGIFTPTEASAAGAVGAFLIALFRRGLGRSVLRTSFEQCIRVTCMIFAIVIGGRVFTTFMALTGLSAMLMNSIIGSGLSPIAMVVLSLFIYVILGCFMEALSMVVLTVPFLYPVFIGFGFDGIWFGVLVVVMIEMALFTPPVGMQLFVARGMFKDVPMMELYKGVIPFIVSDVIRTAILVAFPIISLWIPNAMFGH